MLINMLIICTVWRHRRRMERFKIS